jgi:hypothetical protein
MSAAEDLMLVPRLLAALMTGDARLLLVRAVAWLDPNTLLDGRDRTGIDFDYDAEDDLTVGLHVCRECFPTVYASVLQLPWQSADERTIQRYLLEGINTHLVAPLHDLDELRYGPPIAFCGVSLPTLEPEDEDNPPWDRLLPVFALFGLSAGSDEGSNVAYAAAKALLVSLQERSEAFYQDLVNLLLWMFSCSGNTAVDYTQEDFWENGYDTSSWTLDDITLINEINQEAQEVIASTCRALDVLNNNPMLIRAFSRNIKAALKAIQKRWKGKSNGHFITFSDDDAAAVSRCAHWPVCP